jgi:hypothetical protein
MLDECLFKIFNLLTADRYLLRNWSPWHKFLLISYSFFYLCSPLLYFISFHHLLSLFSLLSLLINLFFLLSLNLFHHFIILLYFRRTFFCNFLILFYPNIPNSTLWLLPLSLFWLFLIYLFIFITIINKTSSIFASSP